MASHNPASQEAVPGGEFHSKVPGSEPLEKGGHKPGVLASEADRAPEFSAQTLPPGTAPKESTYTPNPDINNQKMYHQANDTIGGATSADVHTGLGHPGQGQTSTEIRHDGQHTASKQGAGLTGLVQSQNQSDVNPRPADMAGQRALDKDHTPGQRGTTGGPSAEEQVPETADTVAAEAPRD